MKRRAPLPVHSLLLLEAQGASPQFSRLSLLAFTKVHHHRNREVTNTDVDPKGSTAMTSLAMLPLGEILWCFITTMESI